MTALEQLRENLSASGEKFVAPPSKSLAARMAIKPEDYASPGHYLAALTEAAIEWVDSMYASGHVITVQEFTYKSPWSEESRISYKLFPVPVIYRWVKPASRPTKLKGRKGTKRDWKRSNPPKFKPIANGEPVPEVLIVGAVVMKMLSRHFRAYPTLD